MLLDGSESLKELEHERSPVWTVYFGGGTQCSPSFWTDPPGEEF